MSTITGESTFNKVYGRNVGRGPFQTIESCWLEPYNVRVLSEARLSSHQLTVEGREIHDAEVVLVSRSSNLGTDVHLAMELFRDFALKGFSGGLAGLNLSTRELPLAAKSAALATLGAEDLTVFENYRSNNIDLLRHKDLVSSVPV